MNKDQLNEALSIFKELIENNLISQQEYEQKRQEIQVLISKLEGGNSGNINNNGIERRETTGGSNAVFSDYRQTQETLKNQKLAAQFSSLREAEQKQQSKNVPSSAPLSSNLQNVAVIQAHNGYVFSLALSPTSSCLYSASGDHTIKVWDLETLSCFETLQDHTNTVCSLTIDDDRLYSGGWDQTIRFWDTQTQKCLKSVKGHTNHVSCLARGKDSAGRPVLYSGGFDQSIHVWDLSDYTLKQSMSNNIPQPGGKPANGHTDSVSSLSVARNGFLFSGSYDTSVKLWNSQWKCEKSYRGHKDWVYAVVTKNDTVFSGSRDNTIKMWDMETGQNLSTLTEHTNYVSSLAICGNRLYSGSMDKTIKIWDLSSMQCIQTLTGHTGNVFALIATENTLISGSWDKTIRIWQ
eukprot:TRINITY_DN7913_c0_g1_i1.p1 TRINITY_DN7913_c0_g1~~TRINITY_DN7913_c0_g1_i1.p1  ORF type:complete len:407 (+),score=55.49 TRINITY_DN7913_c0_g1_i1:93-1313(+)